MTLLLALHYTLYRIQVCLGLYGYMFNVYPHYGDEGWPWYRYLYAKWEGLPRYTMSFTYWEDAWGYLQGLPPGYYIRVERHVPEYRR